MKDKQTEAQNHPATQGGGDETHSIPRYDLVGPTVHDDITRAIYRYGAENVKAAVKEATKKKRGRKKEPDMIALREVIEQDARDWLAGKDPFSARSNYAIAKDFAEKHPGHSQVSTHKRIERKLSRATFDRRWYTYVSAFEQSRSDWPYKTYLRALEALASLPKKNSPQIWQFSLERARSTIADYEARNGERPPSDMTFEKIEKSVEKLTLKSLLEPPSLGGMFGAKRNGPAVLGSWAVVSPTDEGGGKH